MNLNKIIKNYLYIIIFLFIFSFFSFNSYASSYIGGKDNISGGGKVTWEEALDNINKRIEYFSSEMKYDISVARRESEYLIYVCLTFNKPYSDYLNLATIFQTEYAKRDTTFKVIDENEYNNQLSAMSTLVSNSNNNNYNDRTLIADSGFNVLLNAFPFFNISYMGGPAGVCAGISAMTLTSYLNPSALTEMNFDNTKTRGTYVYSLSSTLSTDVKFNTSTISILNPYKSILSGDLISYKPDSEFLNAKIPYPGNLCAQNIASKYFSTYGTYLHMDTIENKNDYELLKGLYWMLVWSNDNYKNQKTCLGASLVSDTPCPAEELDLVIEELKNGRPVEVTVQSVTSAHSIIGYRLWQDKLDPNIFYMDVYDSNIPKNSDWSRSDYQPTVVIYKGTVSNRNGLGLYFYYAPLYNSDGTLRTTYRYTDTIHFSDYQGHILHKDNSASKWGSTVDKVGILSK